MYRTRSLTEKNKIPWQESILIQPQSHEVIVDKASSLCVANYGSLFAAGLSNGANGAVGSFGSYGILA